MSFHSIALAVLVVFANVASSAYAAPPPANAQPSDSRLTRLGVGDGLTVEVYGQPDMGSTVFVAEDGSIPVPLVGSVQVSGLSPNEAAASVAKALRDGDFLVDPIVTISVTQSRSQRVSVLGEVGTPGRYVIDMNTTIFDLLAEAGGVKETGSETIYVIRAGSDGNMQRFSIDLNRLLSSPETQSPVKLQAGDSIHVPRSEQFFVYGQVNAPNGYRIEADMTVLQAIARAGGLTSRGSDGRVVIIRQGSDGKYKTLSAKLSDRVLPNDVVQVKERIF